MKKIKKESIEIVTFHPDFNKIFINYKKIIKQNLPTLKLELIGSVAIPMKGKKEIDIMIVTNNIKKIQKQLSKIGFKKGPIKRKTAYLRDYRYGIETEFHIVQKNSKKIENARKLIKILKRNKSLRIEFENLKEKYNGIDRDKYRKRKAKFIKKLLTQ